MELVIVEERKNKHYAYADNGKNELSYKVIIAVALIVISIGIACRNIIIIPIVRSTRMIMQNGRSSPMPTENSFPFFIFL